jgi:hypothetical protein
VPCAHIIIAALRDDVRAYVGGGIWQLSPPARVHDARIERTLGRSVLPPGLALGLFKMANTPSSALPILLLAAGACVASVLAAFERIDWRWSFCGLLALPWVVSAFSVLNLDIILLLLQQFQLIFLVAQLVLVTILQIVMLNHIRVIGIVCCQVCALWLPFTDALPRNHRRYVAPFAVVIGIAYTSALHASFSLGWYGTLNIQLPLLDRQLSLGSVAIGCCSNLVLLQLRTIYVTWRFPNNLVHISTRLECTVHGREDAAGQLPSAPLPLPVLAARAVIASEDEIATS